MSILIRNMGLPEDCPVCPMAYWNAGGSFTGCNAVSGKKFAMDDADYRNGAGRPTWCPLVEVPKRGRLIDADAFEARARAGYCNDCDRRKGVKNGKVRMVYGIGDVPCRACGTNDMLCDIEDCPTVIEAEEV